MGRGFESHPPHPAVPGAPSAPLARKRGSVGARPTGRPEQPPVAVRPPVRRSRSGAAPFSALAVPCRRRSGCPVPALRPGGPGWSGAVADPVLPRRLRPRRPVPLPCLPSRRNRRRSSGRPPRGRCGDARGRRSRPAPPPSVRPGPSGRGPKGRDRPAGREGQPGRTTGGTARIRQGRPVRATRHHARTGRRRVRGAVGRQPRGRPRGPVPFGRRRAAGQRRMMPWTDAAATAEVRESTPSLV